MTEPRPADTLRAATPTARPGVKEPLKTLEQHRAAIETAIKEAYEDGFTLDNGDGDSVTLDINAYEKGDLSDWLSIRTSF
ncbi:hypothetical protein [Streptomyces albidoflavus]|uniref:hypothetical protein n=1 Tax=Streptomyces albidoflavus TaxID=1886 RepID=UPI0005258265|nr:hypothetical protein [Streptomyces albidoflavus]